MKFLGKAHFELKLSFILISILLVAILAYPLFSILKFSFMYEGSFSFANYEEIFGKSNFLTALKNSFVVSSLVALIATTIAFFCAYALNFCAFSSVKQHAFKYVLLLPLFLPSITYGFAIIYSFGRQGLITRTFGQLPFSIYGFNGLLIAGVIYTLPAAFLLLYNSFKYVDRNFITVSKVMGDSVLRTFYMTAIRPVAGSLVGAFILAFFMNFTDFGIPASIAGKYEVISMTLYATMMGAVPSFEKGSVVAMTMLIPSIVAVIILKYCDRLNFRYAKVSLIKAQPHLARDLSFTLFLSLITLTLIAVFAVMFVVPFIKSYPYQMVFTLDTLERIFSDSSIFNVYLNSLMVAFLSAFFGTLICYLAGMINARSNMNQGPKTLLDGFAMVSNTVPGMVLGVGYLFAFSGSTLMNTFLIIILANIVHFFTTPYLMAKQTFSRMNAGFETTAMLMGDSWLKTVFRVVIPNSKTTLIEMFSYIFINSMVTISAIVFLSGARTMVVTSKIKELQYFEKYDAIFVLSLLIFFTNIIVKIILDFLASEQAAKLWRAKSAPVKTSDTKELA